MAYLYNTTSIGGANQFCIIFYISLSSVYDHFSMHFNPKPNLQTTAPKTSRKPTENLRRKLFLNLGYIFARTKEPCDFSQELLLSPPPSREYGITKGKRKVNHGLLAGSPFPLPPSRSSHFVYITAFKAPKCTVLCCHPPPPRMNEGGNFNSPQHL